MSASTFYLPRVWMGSQVAEKALPRPIRPLSAHIKLTENCQAKCISCDYWKTRWQDAINTEQAIDLVNQIAGAGIRSLRLTGGEPLLRKDTFEVLKRANSTLFKNIILQTNGLLLKKLHKEVNDSPITTVAVSVDGLEKTNDLIRGINGYFGLALEGIKLLRGKKVALSVTLNKISAMELSRLREVAHGVGAHVETNILSQSLFFLKDADIASMWPEAAEKTEIVRFVRDELKRPSYEVEYMEKYYGREKLAEPPCVLGFLQVFVLSNGDVLTGCYPLPPVGNILKQSLESILASDAYYKQSIAMIRRECPGCTCGVESSLAMRHAAASAVYELGQLVSGPDGRKREVEQREVAAANAARALGPEEETTAGQPNAHC
jgi:MoaA/NifB/PqqE/SkfB family radical SAM enzyme